MHTTSQRAISNEPVINAIHRYFPLLIAAIYAAGLAYVSFLPFDFTSHTHQSIGFRAHPGRGTPVIVLADLLANVVMFMPLGFLTTAGLLRAGQPRNRAIPVCLAAGLLLSVAIEWGQLWTVSRVSAWPDIAANSVGVFLGIMVFFFVERSLRAAAQDARGQMTRNAWIMAAQCLVVLMLAVQLRPYEIVPNPAQTAMALPALNPHPLAKWSAMPETLRRDVAMGRRLSMTELSHMRWEYALNRASESAAYTLLTVLLVVGLRRTGEFWRGSMLSGGSIVAGLAAATTLMRALIVAHGFDTMHFCCALAGVPAGCLIAWFSMEGNKAVQCVAVGGFTTFACCAVMLHELAPLTWGPRHGAMSWGPLVQLVSGNFKPAFMDMSGDFLRYGLIASLLAIGGLKDTRHWRLRSICIIAFTAAVAAASEWLQLYIPFRSAQLTTICISIFGSGCAVLTIRWSVDYFHSRIAFCDDALTSALIEGPTYDERSARIPGRESRLRGRVAAPSGKGAGTCG